MRSRRLTTWKRPVNRCQAAVLLGEGWRGVLAPPTEPFTARSLEVEQADPKMMWKIRPSSTSAGTDLMPISSASETRP